MFIAGIELAHFLKFRAIMSENKLLSPNRTMKTKKKKEHTGDFMREMSYLGLNMSKAFVRSPQFNSCIERFHRTLEEELFSVENFSSFNDAYKKNYKFINDYNYDRIMHLLNCLSPLEYWAEHAESQRKLKDLLWISDRNRLVLNNI